MSTRANVIIKDGSEKLFFYRHSDGYPEGVKDTLDAFCRMIEDGEIRRNVGQAAGWLIILGHEEYAMSRRMYNHTKWKVGAYEPTTGLHGDIEHLYEVDLNKATWEEVKLPANIREL